MKRFMFLSIGVLCLAIAVLIGFYVGSQRAEAQATPDAKYFFIKENNYSHYFMAILPDGDIYENHTFPGTGIAECRFKGNFWNGLAGTDSKK